MSVAVCCLHCGRYREEALVAGSTHCAPPFEVQRHKYSEIVVTHDNVHEIFDAVNEHFSARARKPFFDPCTREWDVEEGLKFFGNALTGEAGEVSDLIKKMMRGDYEPTSDVFLDKLKREIADVQIYIRHLVQLINTIDGHQEESEIDYMILKGQEIVERWPEIFDDTVPF